MLYLEVSVTRITINHSMDLLQVQCIIHIGYKDNYIIYTSAGVIQWQGDTQAWGRRVEHPWSSKP